MNLKQIQKEIYDRFEELSDKQLHEIIRVAQLRLSERESMKDYDPANDPIMQGETLISGPTDLSERVEDILYGEETPVIQHDEKTS